MPILTGTNLTLSFGEREILRGVSIGLEPGEKIGIVGRNGSGKSTLLKILAGLVKQDVGDVNAGQGVRVGYLQQNPKLEAGDTLKEAAARAFEYVDQLQSELDEIFHQMGEAKGDELEKLLRQQERIEKTIEASGGYHNDHKVDQILHGLGFTDAQFNIRIRDLSGGQKARVALGRLLLENPGVLLLDEPTNHLDVAGREWLETFLSEEYPGAVILISHDRYLLDKVVSRIVEIEDGRLIDYPGNYAAFRKQRVERRITMLRAWEKQQTMFKREEAYIRQYKAGQRAKQAKGRESRLDRAKEDALERPIELDDIKLNLPKAERTGDIVIAARGLSKQYENEHHKRKVLFNDLTVHIERGQRWGIIGPNGAGKTTLVRCMLGEITPDDGQIKLGAKLAVGYFSQDRSDIDPEKTVYRHIQDTVRKATEERVMMNEQDARNLAGAFLFSGREQEKQLGVMSGGEQARAVLAGLLASAKNVLVLDEPTNHLDIQACERLEDTLARTHENPMTGEKTSGDFDGTIILISHDRALIDAVCDHILVLDGEGSAEIFPGTYSDWKLTQTEREQIKQTAAKPSETPKSPATASPSTGAGSNAPKSRFSWMPVDKIEQRMNDLGIEVRKLDAELGEADVWTDYEKANALSEKRDELQAELDELETEWLRKSE